MDETRRSSDIKSSHRTSLILSLIFIFFYNYAHAEYRAHQYVITNKTTNENYSVISSLNPTAYVAYHGGSMTIGLELINTWLCPGYTGKKKPICQSPEQRLNANQEKI